MGLHELPGELLRKAMRGMCAGNVAATCRALSSTVLREFMTAPVVVAVDLPPASLPAFRMHPDPMMFRLELPDGRELVTTDHEACTQLVLMKRAAERSREALDARQVLDVVGRKAGVARLTTEYADADDISGAMLRVTAGEAGQSSLVFFLQRLILWKDTIFPLIAHVTEGQPAVPLAAYVPFPTDPCRHRVVIH